MTKKITILFLTHSFLLYLTQTKPPESYSLIRGVNENINLNSGAVDLNIPLFDITDGSLKLGNNLTYESQGFVPHIAPSYVGTNWKMMQFGKITRESRRIDFTTSNTPLLFRPASSTELNTIITNSRNYFRNDCINVGFRPIGGSFSYKKNIYNNPFEKDYYASIYFPDLPGGQFLGGYAGKSYDFDPDKYYFDFMGYTGYFLVDNEGKPIVYCENASLKVDIMDYGCHDIFGDITFSQFTITDDKGNKYFFGGNSNALDINYSFNRVNVTDQMFYVPNVISIENLANKTNYIDSWSLTKVELQNGTIINAHYKHGNTGVLNNFRGFNTQIHLNTFNNESFIPYYDNIGFPDKQTLKDNNLVINHVRQFTDTDTRSGGFLGQGGRAFKHVQIDTYSKRAVLDSITSNNITIGYEYIDSNNPLELTNNYLDKIIIKRKNKLIKQVNFIYENLGLTNKRTFLKKIVSTGNEEIKFDYYNTGSFPPYKNSYYLTNELGFWNGMTDSNPNFNQYVDYGFSDNLDKFNVGLLEKVTYSTKGSTTYIYENGDYSKIYKYNDLNNPEYLILANENKTVNAPRIYKKIVNDLKSTPVETFFKYKNDDNSSSGIIDGVLFFIPNASYGGTLTKKNSSSNLLSQNSLHYSTVTESMQQKGFIKYRFTDRITNPDIYTNKITKNPSNPFPFRCDPTWYGRDEILLSKQNERGKLLKQEIYGNNIKLKETAFEYNSFLNKFPNLDIAVGCSNCKISDLNYYVKTISTSTPSNACYIQTMYVPVLPYLQSSQTTKEYFGNNVIETTKKIVYNDNANDWHPHPIEESVTTSAGTHIKKYLYAPDLLKKDCRGFMGCPNDNSVVGSQWDIYEGMIISNFLTPLVEITKNTDNKFSLKENLFTPGDTFLFAPKKIRHSLVNAVAGFDNYNIPLANNLTDDIEFNVYDSKANNLQTTMKNGIPVTTIYGYDQTLPIATISGISYEQLMQIYGLPVTPTGYLSLDIVSKSNADKDEASEQLLINALDSFRNNPALANYQITTYTYDPLIGAKSITQPSGLREVYIYDTANRLKEIRENSVTGKMLKEYKYNYKN